MVRKRKTVWRTPGVRRTNGQKGAGIRPAYAKRVPVHKVGHATDYVILAITLERVGRVF